MKSLKEKEMALLKEIDEFSKKNHSKFILNKYELTMKKVSKKDKKDETIHSRKA